MNVGTVGSSDIFERSTRMSQLDRGTARSAKRFSPSQSCCNRSYFKAKADVVARWSRTPHPPTAKNGSRGSNWVFQSDCERDKLPFLGRAQAEPSCSVVWTAASEGRRQQIIGSEFSFFFIQTLFIVSGVATHQM